MGVEEEGELRGEVVDEQAGLEGGLDVGDAVGEGEGDFLDGGGAGLADVVAADGDGVPTGEFCAQYWKMSVMRRMEGAGGKM